jgi:quercetin dioxygenase-like cupin family protein
VVAAAVCVGLCAFSASAAATPAEGDVVRTDLAKGETQAPVSINTDGGQPTTLLVQNLVLRPGAHSGWHTHPGPEFSVITDGAVSLRLATDCSVSGYGEGQAVFIPAGVVHKVENTGPADAAVVANYTLPSGAPPRGDAPEACLK